MKYDKKDIERRLKKSMLGHKCKIIANLPKLNTLEELMVFDADFFRHNPNEDTYARPFHKYDLNNVVNIKDKFEWTIVREINPNVRMRAFTNNITILN